MALEILRAKGCERDLAVILDQLVEGYRALGDTLAEAVERAAARVRAIEAAMAGLGRTAFLARRRDDVAPGLRQIAAERAVYSFVVDEAAGEIRILAVFLAAGPGAPDLRTQLLARLGAADPPARGRPAPRDARPETTRAPEGARAGEAEKGRAAQRSRNARVK